MRAVLVTAKPRGGKIDRIAYPEILVEDPLGYRAERIAYAAHAAKPYLVPYQETGGKVQLHGRAGGCLCQKGGLEAQVARQTEHVAAHKVEVPHLRVLREIDVALAHVGLYYLGHGKPKVVPVRVQERAHPEVGRPFGAYVLLAGGVAGAVAVVFRQRVAVVRGAALEAKPQERAAADAYPVGIVAKYPEMFFLAHLVAYYVQPQGKVFHPDRCLDGKGIGGGRPVEPRPLVAPKGHEAKAFPGASIGGVVGLHVEVVLGEHGVLLRTGIPGQHKAQRYCQCGGGCQLFDICFFSHSHYFLLFDKYFLPLPTCSGTRNRSGFRRCPAQVCKNRWPQGACRRQT